MRVIFKTALAVLALTGASLAGVTAVQARGYDGYGNGNYESENGYSGGYDGSYDGYNGRDRRHCSRDQYRDRHHYRHNSHNRYGDQRRYSQRDRDRDQDWDRDGNGRDGYRNGY